MSQLIVSVQYKWKDGNDAATVAAAHKAFSEMCATIPGCRVFLVGLNEATKTSQSYEVYDTADALKILIGKAFEPGSPLTPLYEVVEVAPGTVSMQGTKATLDSIADIAGQFGATLFYTDSQDAVHVNL